MRDEAENVRLFTYKRVWLLAAFMAVSMFVGEVRDGVADAAVFGSFSGIGIGAACSLFVWFFRTHKTAGDEFEQSRGRR